MTTFHLGQKFSSFLEFEQYLSCYENENFVKFYKRDSRKIESAVRAGKTTKVELNPDLIYYEVKYSCVRGGPYRVQGTGKRKTSSAKIECLAHISLRAAADGKTLEVKSFDNTHNHEASKVLFDHLPQQRRLTDTEKDKARELLSLQANKKLIQQKLQEETGKIITLRDLSNLAKGVKSSSNELHEAVSLLQEKYQQLINVECMTTLSVESEAALPEEEESTIHSDPASPAVREEQSKTQVTAKEALSMFRRSLKKKHPGQSASSKAADAILKETELQINLKRKHEEREALEHELRVKLLKRQIEVQEKVLEILNSNPEKLNFKF